MLGTAGEWGSICPISARKRQHPPHLPPLCFLFPSIHVFGRKNQNNTGDFRSGHTFLLQWPHAQQNQLRPVAPAEECKATFFNGINPLAGPNRFLFSEGFAQSHAVADERLCIPCFHRTFDHPPELATCSFVSHGACTDVYHSTYTALMQFLLSFFMYI